MTGLLSGIDGRCPIQVLAPASRRPGSSLRASGIRRRARPSRAAAQTFASSAVPASRRPPDRGDIAKRQSPERIDRKVLTSGSGSMTW